MERKKLIYVAVAVTTSVALGVGYVLHSRNTAPTVTGDIEPSPVTQPTNALPEPISTLTITPPITIKSPDTGATYKLDPSGCVIVGETEVGNPETAFGASRALGYPETEVIIYKNGQEIGRFGGGSGNKLTSIGIYQPNEVEVCPAGR